MWIHMSWVNFRSDAYILRDILIFRWVKSRTTKLDRGESGVLGRNMFRMKWMDFKKTLRAKLFTFCPEHICLKIKTGIFFLEWVDSKEFHKWYLLIKENQHSRKKSLGNQGKWISCILGAEPCTGSFPILDSYLPLL